MTGILNQAAEKRASKQHAAADSVPQQYKTGVTLNQAAGVQHQAAGKDVPKQSSEQATPVPNQAAERLYGATGHHGEDFLTGTPGKILFLTSEGLEGRQG